MIQESVAVETRRWWAGCAIEDILDRVKGRENGASVSELAFSVRPLANVVAVTSHPFDDERLRFFHISGQENVRRQEFKRTTRQPIALAA